MPPAQKYQTAFKPTQRISAQDMALELDNPLDFGYLICTVIVTAPPIVALIYATVQRLQDSTCLIEYLVAVASLLLIWSVEGTRKVLNLKSLLIYFQARTALLLYLQAFARRPRAIGAVDWHHASSVVGEIGVAGSRKGADVQRTDYWD